LFSILAKVANLVCHTVIGIAYAKLGKYEKAVEYQEQAIKISRSIGN
jgi:tetratricopeptide (TPR) repeat protein